MIGRYRPVHWNNFNTYQHQLEEISRNRYTDSAQPQVKGSLSQEREICSKTFGNLPYILFYGCIISVSDVSLERLLSLIEYISTDRFNWVFFQNILIFFLSFKKAYNENCWDFIRNYVAAVNVFGREKRIKD